MISFTVKENHISLPVSKILRYTNKYTDIPTAILLNKRKNCYLFNVPNNVLNVCRRVTISLDGEGGGSGGVLAKHHQLGVPALAGRESVPV